MKIFPLRNRPTLAGGWVAWMQALIIVGMLFLAAGIGAFTYNRWLKLLGLVPIALAFFVWMIRYPPWGIIALVPFAFLVDIPINTGTMVIFNVIYLFVILLIAIWLLRMLVMYKDVRLKSSPINLPALLFIAACTLAWLTSFLPWVPLATVKPSLFAQLGAYLLYVLSIGLVLLFGNVLQNLKQVKILTWTFVVLGSAYWLVVVILGFYPYGRSMFVDELYHHPLGITWLAALALGQALFNRRLGWLLRLGLILIAALCFIYHLAWGNREWIAGWSVPLIAVVLLLWLWDWRVGAAITGLGALIYFTSLTGIASQVNTPSQQWSSLTRQLTWPIVLDLIKLNPITGLGPAAYRFYTQFYSYYGYYLPFNTHNNYFDIVLQTGLLGLAAFAWLVAAIFRLGWKLRGQAADGFSRGYINAVLAGLAATLVAGVMSDWFLPFLYNSGVPGFQVSIFPWLFVGGMVGLYQIQKKDETE